VKRQQPVRKRVVMLRNRSMSDIQYDYILWWLWSLIRETVMFCTYCNKNWMFLFICLSFLAVYNQISIVIFKKKYRYTVHKCIPFAYPGVLSLQLWNEWLRTKNIKEQFPALK
jgi:hypothetical protein